MVARRLTRRRALAGADAAGLALGGMARRARAAGAAPITIVIDQSPWFDS